MEDWLRGLKPEYRTDDHFSFFSRVHVEVCLFSCRQNTRFVFKKPPILPQLSAIPGGHCRCRRFGVSMLCYALFPTKGERSSVWTELNRVSPSVATVLQLVGRLLVAGFSKQDLRSGRFLFFFFFFFPSNLHECNAHDWYFFDLFFPQMLNEKDSVRCVYPVYIINYSYSNSFPLRVLWKCKCKCKSTIIYLSRTRCRDLLLFVLNARTLLRWVRVRIKAPIYE